MQGGGYGSLGPGDTYTMKVGPVSWTYVIAPHALEVSTLLVKKSIPWQTITAFGIGTNEYMSHLLVLHMAPGMSKPKLETFNVDTGDLGTRAIIAAMQARVPQGFRGTLPLLQLRKAMGISNAWVWLVTLGIVLLVIGGIGLFAWLDH